MIKKFVCILKSGGDYTPRQVINLYNQCTEFLSDMDEFICYTDMEINHPEITVKPLIGNLSGRWSMQEAFREVGHVIVTGLDTLFLKDMNWLWKVDVQQNQFYGMHSFKRDRKWANSPMIWKGDWSRLFLNYDNQKASETYSLEQDWTAKKLRNENAQLRYIDDEGLKISSYKRHLLKNKKKLEDVDIVIFHGHPRPHNLSKKSIVGQLYNSFN